MGHEQWLDIVVDYLQQALWSHHPDLWVSLNASFRSSLSPQVEVQFILAFAKIANLGALRQILKEGHVPVVK